MSVESYSLMFAAVTALATLAVPVVLAVMANRFNDRLKEWEANQWRNQELIKARLESYREMVPFLNDMMCYFTFVGPWKDFTPPEIIALKRNLDRAFYCATPLLGEQVQTTYQEFIALCFRTYGSWGDDAKLKTGFGRRKTAAGARWDTSWESLFDPPPAPIAPDVIREIRAAYNAVIAAFASDIGLQTPRRQYVAETGQLGAY